jgi:hypothetical protein
MGKPSRLDNLKSKFDRKYWPLMKTVMWIEYRSKSLTAEQAENESLTFFGMKSYPTMHPFKSVGHANELIEKLMNGDIRAEGKRNAVGSMELIKAIEWNTLQLVFPHVYTNTSQHIREETWMEIHFEKNEIIEMWPYSLGKFSPNTKGRPSYMPRIKHEMEKRNKLGLTNTSLAKEAQELSKWWIWESEGKNPIQAKTIQNTHSDFHKELLRKGSSIISE